MLNPLIQLAKSNPMMEQIKQMRTMLQTAQNPTAMLNQMVMSNPQLKQVMDIVQQHGGDSMKAFYAVAKQKCIDPNEILNMLK